MFVKDVTVQNKVGLHARPATFFIQKANEFKSSIWVEKEERRVNAKSLLGVLSLGIVGGTAIKVIADGPDEQDAVEALVKLVLSGFEEELNIKERRLAFLFCILLFILDILYIEEPTTNPISKGGVFLKASDQPKFSDVPQAFSDAMAQNVKAMKNFSRLTQFEQQGVIDHAKSLKTAQEVKEYVNKIGSEEVTPLRMRDIEL